MLVFLVFAINASTIMETVTWSSSSGNLFGGWCSWRWQASEHVLNYSASHIGLVYLSHGLSLLRVNLVLLNKCSLESSSKRKLDSCMLSKKKEMASNWEISLNCRIQPTTFSHISKTLPKFLLNFFNWLNYHLRSGLWTAGSYTPLTQCYKNMYLQIDPCDWHSLNWRVELYAW